MFVTNMSITQYFYHENNQKSIKIRFIVQISALSSFFIIDNIIE